MATKEEICQQQLRPLLEQMEKICNEHGINAAAQFILDVNPDDPLEHRTCTFFAAGNKDDEVAVKKLMNAAIFMLGPEGLVRFVEEAKAFAGQTGGIELDLGHLDRDPTPDSSSN